MAVGIAHSCSAIGLRRLRFVGDEFVVRLIA